MVNKMVIISIYQCCVLKLWWFVQWLSQTFSDGRAHNCHKIKSIVIYRHAGSYVHLLNIIVCMKMHTNSIVKLL